MQIIGLTGSIGMGKSTLAEQFQFLGVPVHDADACVHELLSPNGKAYRAVLETFPSALNNGSIDRKALGKIIFNDPEKRTILESILYPLVRESSAKFIQLCRRRRVRICVLDIPLLFEMGRDKYMDKIICVTAPQWVQNRRVLSRPNMTANKFKSVRSLQLSDMRKRHLSDHIIQTGRGKRFSLNKVKSLIKAI